MARSETCPVSKVFMFFIELEFGFSEVITFLGAVRTRTKQLHSQLLITNWLLRAIALARLNRLGDVAFDDFMDLFEFLRTGVAFDMHGVAQALIAGLYRGIYA
jgi:hypothetical protein